MFKKLLQKILFILRFNDNCFFYILNIKGIQYCLDLKI